MLLIDISKFQKVDKPKVNVCVLYIKCKDKNITDVQWFSVDCQWAIFKLYHSENKWNDDHGSPKLGKIVTLFHPPSTTKQN
jgi:hypothetical protein